MSCGKRKISSLCRCSHHWRGHAVLLSIWQQYDYQAGPGCWDRVLLTDVLYIPEYCCMLLFALQALALDTTLGKRISTQRQDWTHQNIWWVFICLFSFLIDERWRVCKLCHTKLLFWVVEKAMKQDPVLANLLLPWFVSILWLWFAQYSEPL